MPSKYDPDKHHRRSIRLKHYDYSTSGHYFVTICIQNRACLLGNIVAGQMQLNDAGRMVKQSWIDLPNRFPHIALDKFIVMPNHFHGIISLHNPVGAPLVGTLDNPCHDPISLSNPSYQSGITQTDNHGPRAGTRPAHPQNHSLGQIIGAFKSMTTHNYIAGVNHKDWQPFHHRLWQRNYYDHIIRNNSALQRLQHYITLNHECWENDQLHPQLS